MKTERKTVNKQEYLVTDYMYEGDNVGINLKTLKETKTSKKMAIPCLPMSSTERLFSSTTNVIEVNSKIGISDDNKIQVIFHITYPDKKDTIYIDLDDDVFANDMINTCILDKRDIKDIACYKAAIDATIEQIKQKALSESILIKTHELDYKCYIYTEDLIFLGTANRILEMNNRNGFVLGEYCGKKLTDFIDNYGEDATKLVIDMCINDNSALQLRDVELVSTTDSTLGYATISMEHAKAVKIDNTHDSISYNIPANFILPEYKLGSNHETYYEQFLIGNSPSDIEKFYKLNKVSTNPTININKYLIW